MKNIALIISGIIFSLVAALHFIRYFKGWHIVVDHFTVPLHWSIYGGLFALILALWMFASAGK